MAYSMDHYLVALNGDYGHSTRENSCYTPLSLSNKNSPELAPPVTLSPLFKNHNLVIKRLFDIAISVMTTVLLLWWLLPLIALSVKIDSGGPIFFIQKRNKKSGRLFHCFKFRTMLVNEDADTLTSVLNDSRVTGLGKILRKSHLDELPQFINVLKGDMSVVGPRPHMVTENIRFKGILNFYNDRHFVKPGITGLAQSFGLHGPINDLVHLEKKIAYDIFYIKNWSVIMDIKILIRTIGMIFKKLNPAQ
jgi:putative colanic acid biosynthesis UDP-glucose lipid carrier transferase